MGTQEDTFSLEYNLQYCGWLVLGIQLTIISSLFGNQRLSEKPPSAKLDLLIS